MALVITLNAILAFVVIVVVIAPLAWAILTQHRDAADSRLYAGRRPQLAPQAAHGTRRPLYEPVARPA